MNLLSYIQILLAILLVIGILLQPTDTDAGGSFGGGSVSTWHTRRGGEKFIFMGTILLSILFVISIVIDLM